MREGREFLRRSWRHHPLLTALQVACGLGLAVLGLTAILADGLPAWSSLLRPLLIAGGFVCFVLLVRRDEPRDDA